MDRGYLWVNVFGKTEELIRRVKRAKLAKQKVKILNQSKILDTARKKLPLMTIIL